MQLARAALLGARPYSSSAEPDLKATLKEVIPAKRELLKKVKAHGSKVIGEVKVENTLGGMRGKWTRSTTGVEIALRNPRDNFESIYCSKR